MPKGTPRDLERDLDKDLECQDTGNGLLLPEGRVRLDIRDKSFPVKAKWTLAQVSL